MGTQREGTFVKRRKLVLVLVTLPPMAALLLTIGAVLLSQRPVETGLVDGRLRPCPGSPNCVNSQGPDPSIEPLRFPGDPDAAFASLLDFLRAQPRAEVLEVEDGYAHVVVWTPFLKFADDLELLLAPAERAIHVRSASRVGRSDLGTNRARVDALRRGWRPPAAAAER